MTGENEPPPHLSQSIERLEHALDLIRAAVDSCSTPSGTPPGTRHSSESLKHFEIRREMIVHEDHQINHRITVLLTTQSILFTAAVIALTASNRLNAVEALHVRHLVFALAAAGSAFAGVMARAIWAARQEQKLVKSEQHYGKHMDCGEFLTPCLQASDHSTFYGGHSYTYVLCAGSATLWLIVVFGVYRSWL